MPDSPPTREHSNFDKRIVFLHIAKTAGTSILHFFRRHFPEASVCSHGDFLQFPAGRMQFQQRLLEHRFISGHFGYRHVASLLDDCYSFTFLRDPVDRVLSFYGFCRHADMQRQFPVARAACELGLDGFVTSTLPEVCEVVDSQQAWQLASMYWREDREVLSALTEDQLLAIATRHLDAFSYIGLTEHFAEDFSAILADLGIPGEAPRKRQFANAEPVDRSQLSPSALATLQERLALDYRLLASARALRGQPRHGH